MIENLIEVRIEMLSPDSLNQRKKTDNARIALIPC